MQNLVWRLDDLIIEGDRVAARLTGRFEHMWYLLDAQTIEKQLAA